MTFELNQLLSTTTTVFELNQIQIPSSTTTAFGSIKFDRVRIYESKCCLFLQLPLHDPAFSSRSIQIYESKVKLMAFF